ERVKGVTSVVSGYTGGSVANASYEQVSTGKTGHAESVRITFDPKAISFREILEIFFATHDPTTLDRQGADVGSQYRSAIFYETTEQSAEAEKMLKELEAAHTWDNPIVTEVKPLTAFYPAEKYHQRYYDQHSEQPYCQVVINPKLEKLQQKFAARLKADG
ncbi:MAG: peptide-methionine (S)-S-oxide reductase, partial [Chloroflexi bacterium RBG_16_57_8]